MSHLHDAWRERNEALTALKEATERAEKAEAANGLARIKESMDDHVMAVSENNARDNIYLSDLARRQHQKLKSVIAERDALKSALEKVAKAVEPNPLFAYHYEARQALIEAASNVRAMAASLSQTPGASSLDARAKPEEEQD